MATDRLPCEIDPALCNYGPHYCVGLCKCDFQTEAMKKAFTGNMFVPFKPRPKAAAHASSLFPVLL